MPCPLNFLIEEDCCVTPELDIENITTSNIAAAGAEFKHVMLGPYNDAENTLNDPNPNLGPYATEMWPVGTHLTESGNKYVFCKTYAGNSPYQSGMEAQRVMTSGGVPQANVATEIAVTFPNPVTAGSKTFAITFTALTAPYAVDYFKDAYLIFTTPNSVTLPTPRGEYRIKSSLASSTQIVTVTLHTAINADITPNNQGANSTLAQFIWERYGLWPCRAVDTPNFVSIVKTTGAQPYAWFMSEGRAVLQCAGRAQTGDWPAMNNPMQGDQIFVLENGTATNRTAYNGGPNGSADDTGKVCTIPSPIWNVTLNGPLNVTGVTVQKGIRLSYDNVFDSTMWDPFMTAAGADIPGAGATVLCQRFNILLKSGAPVELTPPALPAMQLRVVNTVLAGGEVRTIDVIQENAHPPVGMCKTSTEAYGAPADTEIIVNINLT